ncbi:MAG TPA: TIM barrel protein [Phycisphaerae bacterium]|nr:TIM barrel protein [Phycisphaerae bacterium]
MAATARLTMLNAMGGADIAASLDRHVGWGLRQVDLKDAIFGKGVLDLDDAEIVRLRAMLDQRQLTVATMSTVLFHPPIERGQEAFRADELGRIGRAMEIAQALQPRCVRLLAAQTEAREQVLDTTPYLRARHPWVFAMYREAIGRLSEAGFRVLIENEVGRCIWSRPEEVLGFFEELGGGSAASFMWDVQNLWQMGTFPSLPVYRQLRPIIGQVHLKGGIAERPGGPLKWRSSLQDASWPVEPILREIIADGVSAVLCLNPSHGQAPDGYDQARVTERDIAFLRGAFPEIE